MRLFRICRVKHGTRDEAFSGIGVTMAGMRWTRKSAALRGVYVADSLALSCLETLVHLNMKPRVFPRSVYFMLEVPDAHIECADLKDLPPDWKADVPTPACQDYGTAFLIAKRAVGLALPTVIQDHGTNVLLNPLHDAFDLKWISGPFPYEYDERLA
jgi:RES domain-containing protein